MRYIVHRRFSTTLTFPFHSPSSHRTVSSWMFVEDVTVLGLSSFIIVDSFIIAFRLFFWYFLQCLLLSRPRYHYLSASLFPAPHFRDHSGFGPCLEVKWRRVYCVWKINYITMRFKYHFPIGRNTINPCFLTFSFLLFDS